MSDGGDGEALMMSPDIQHVWDLMRFRYVAVDPQWRPRIDAIFRTALTPARMEQHYRHPDVFTDAGAVITVFPEGSPLRQANDNEDQAPINDVEVSPVMPEPIFSVYFRYQNNTLTVRARKIEDPEETDGGDDAAAILSQNMAEVMRSLCTYYGNQDITRRVEQIFHSKLKPAQIERYAHLPGAETAAGVEIQVFPPGSEFHVPGDPLQFEFRIRPGEYTLVHMYNDAGAFAAEWETDTFFNPGPSFPDRWSWIDYRDNKLIMYDVDEEEEPPAESDGGDDPMAAFVDLGA